MTQNQTCPECHHPRCTNCQLMTVASHQPQDSHGQPTASPEESQLEITREDQGVERTNSSVRLVLPATLLPYHVSDTTTLGADSASTRDHSGEWSPFWSLLSFRWFVRSHGTLQSILFLHHGKTKPTKRIRHYVHFDSGATDNFTSITTVEECGLEEHVYKNPNDGLVYPYNSKGIPSKGFIDIKCRFFCRRRWLRWLRWLPISREIVITFRVLDTTDDSEARPSEASHSKDRPSKQFIIGTPWMKEHGILVP